MNRYCASAGAVAALAAVSLLTGCTCAGAGQVEIATSSAAPASSAPAAPADPPATVIAVTPAPEASPIPSESSEPTEPALSREDMDADRLVMEEFLDTAWDTMKPKRLGDVSLGDCLYFDYDYQDKTTALFTVDCSTSHESEVMAIYQHPDSEYPGQAISVRPGTIPLTVYPAISIS